MRESGREPSGNTAVFGPFTLSGASAELWFRGRPLTLALDHYTILAALVAAAGAPVAEEVLIAALAALAVPDAGGQAAPPDAIDDAGLARDAALLWTRVAVLNRVLDACSPESAYIAHFPERGFALVVPSEPARPQTMARPPVRVSSAIGCDDAVAAIALLLSRHRCVSIVAAGGMGKTTLAAVLVEDVSARFRDGVCFVDLAPMADARFLPNVLASALGVGLGPGSASAGLNAFLRDKHMLIVFDSCEHIVAAAADLIERMLRAAPALHVLATTREPLRASGEWIYRHGPMRLPVIQEGITATQAIAWPAVQLFAERAGADGFVLDDGNAALACAICQRLDGIPLAIELAAARVALLGIAGLAEQLRDRPLSSAGGRRSSVTRHRTLRAMLDWSFDLLSEPEQTAFAKLALYRGEFTLAAASALLSDTPDGTPEATDTVLELIAKSLVVRRDAGLDQRLRLLDTTRAYAADKLDAGGGRYALMARHVQYLCSLLDVAQRDWLLMARGPWLERYAFWMADIRIALDWAFGEGGEILLGSRLAAAAFSLGHHASLAAEFTAHVDRALAMLAGAGIRDILLETRIIALVCTINRYHGDDDDLRRALTAACDAAPASVIHQYATALSTGWWAAAFGQGRYPVALERAEAIVARAGADGDKVVALIAERTQAQSLHFLGRQRQARALAANVLENSWRKIPLVFNPSPVDVQVSMRIVLARISWMDGCPDQAHAIAAECLAYAVADTAVSLAQALALCSVPLALWCGDRAAAGEQVERLALHAERHSLEFWTQWALRYRDVLAASDGDDAAAQRLATPAAMVFENVQRDHLVTFDARCLAPDSIARVESGMAGWCAPELLRAQAEQLAQRGRAQAAEALLRRSIALAREQQTLGWELRGATSLARLWQQQDRAGAAHELLAPVVARLQGGAATADQCQARALLAQLQPL